MKVEDEWDDVSREDNFDFTFSGRKGFTVLVSQGYGYSRGLKLNSGGFSYRCVRHDCAGRLHVGDDGLTLMRVHNHDSDTAYYEMRRGLVNIIKHAVVSSEPLKTVVEEECSRMSDEACAKLPQFKSIQRLVVRKQKANKICDLT